MSSSSTGCIAYFSFRHSSVDRAAKFSCLVNLDNNLMKKMEIVKQELVDLDSNPNSHLSSAVSNPVVDQNPVADQNPKSTTLKDKEKSGCGEVVAGRRWWGRGGSGFEVAKWGWSADMWQGNGGGK
ncbi:hypothetical protein ACH5RR_026701 [Cinchona calisaya]|uniref:Uncharacterized protein n=1 Tax=Cinchona calisaya TaxID=153742 RepID=A0ABD2Z5C1_9GENT